MLKYGQCSQVFYTAGVFLIHPLKLETTLAAFDGPGIKVEGTLCQLSHRVYEFAATKISPRMNKAFIYNLIIISLGLNSTLKKK